MKIISTPFSRRPCLRLIFSTVLIVLIFRSRAQTVANTNIWYNSTNSYLGVGESNPLTQLHVSGNAAAVVASAGTINGFVQLWADNALIWKQGNTYTGLRFGSASNLNAGTWSEKMRLTDDGLLGIGTSSPQSMLDVRGNVTATGFMLTNNNAGLNDNVLRSTFGANQFDVIGTYNGWDPNGVFIAGYNSSSASPVTKAAQKVYIGSPFSGTNNYMCVNFVSGNVGIGVVNPSATYKLAVEGVVGARKVIVTQASWSDYVFDPGYRLPSLDSVSRYVKANRHLPDVPSADSVAANGLDLGGNQSQLLKKIEELTLYVISLQKQVDELKAEKKVH